MRKIVSMMSVSLDGFIEGPNREIDWHRVNTEMLRHFNEEIREFGALLRGERVTTDGRYVKLDGVALDWSPAEAPEVLTGATGPRTLRLAGEVADGTVLTASTTVDGVRRARRLIDEGRLAAGRTAGHHRVVVYLHTATGADAAARLRAEIEADGEDPVPEHGVAGDADTVAKAVQRLADAGADTVVLQPTADEPAPEGFVRFAAEQVRPLLPQDPPPGRS